MASGSQQAFAGLEGKAEAAGWDFTGRFGVQLDQPDSQMSLRGRDAVGHSVSEEGGSGDGQRRDPRPLLLIFQCWVWAPRAGSKSRIQCASTAEHRYASPGPCWQPSHVTLGKSLHLPLSHASVSPSVKQR